MNFRLVFHICVFLWTLNLSEGFFANQFSQFVESKDYTHADITEIGILQAVAEYFESTPATPGGSTLGVGSLTAIQNITAKKLFDKYYGGTRSAKRFQEAIDQIIRYNNKVDLDHYNEAAWHFNGEQITEANKKLIDIRGNLLKELRKSQPNYESARELIGQFFHIMQMFYSNTNFIDQIGQNMYPAIGLTGTTLMKTAGAGMDTCKSCKSPRHPCVFNILHTIKAASVLTSGYKGGQDIKKPFKDPTSATEGKCSHGGPTDPDQFKSAATGGINKDSSHPLSSPHFYKHALAAKAAIDHTKYFFQDATVGLHTLIGEDNYKKLLQINPSHSLVFVIDQSGSMAAELPIIAQESRAIIQNASASSNAPENYILVTFSDPGTSTLVKDTTKSTDMISWIGAIQATGGNDCPEFSLTGIEAAANAAHPDSILYVFTDSTPKDPYKQEKINSLIASKRLRIFFLVMGTCSTTNQNGLKFSDNLNHVIGRKRRDVEDDNTLIDENNANQTNAVLVLKRHIAADESPMVEVPVDKTLQEIQIDIQGDTAMPYPVIRKPNKEYLNIDGNEVFETRYQDNMVAITIRNPAPGIWGVFRFDKATWNIEVTGQSMLDFEYRILKDGEMPHYQESRIVEVEIKRGDQDVMMYNLVIGNTLGDTLHKIALTRVNASNKNLYECKLDHYQDDYVFGIEGLDSDGNQFQRFHKSISHVIKERSTNRQEPLRHKRSTTTWDPIDVYRHLASVSGGHVFQTTKDQIPNAFGILQSSLSGAEVLILQNVYPGGPSSPKSFEIAVDASISQFTLKMHGKQDIPRFILKDSRGNVNQIDNKTITLYNIGTTYLSVVVKNPSTGIWTVRKNDISEWDVEVTARSTLDFTAKLMKNYPTRFSLYEISGRPIPDENVTLVIEVNDKTVIKDLSDVSLLDVYGDEIAHYSLKKKNSFSNRGFFRTSIIVPHETFKLAVIGTTSTGGPFIRMHRDVIEPVNIKLDHIPEKVPLYIKENLNVSFIVKNAGSQDEDVKVTIKDDKHFAISPQSRTFHLKAWSNQTSYFTVHGGQTKGETTTITLTAKPATPSGTNTKYQYIITYLTVEERKIDKIPPVCNVTSSPVSCGSDPCKCTQTNVYITAEIWDEGDGLDEITAPNTPTNSLLLNGYNKGLVKAVGIVRATLMVNCCRKNVTIDVKDLKNLTGSCDIPVDPTYDVNACTTTTPSTTTVTTTPTSTTMTSTSTSTITSTTTPTTTSSSSTLSTTPTSTSSTKMTVSSALSSSTTSSAVLSSTTPSPSSTSAKTSSTVTTPTKSTTPKKSSTSTKSSTSVSKTSTKVSSSISAGASVSTTQRTSTSKMKSTTNPTAKKEDNSSTVSDGVSYAIAAVVGSVTVAVIIGGIFIVTKKMSAVSPKKTDNTL